MIRMMNEVSRSVIPNFTIIEKLHLSPKTVIYRAINDTTNSKVILKVLNEEHPRRHLIRYKQEFTILKELNDSGVKGVIRVHQLISTSNRLALEMEDIGAISLKQYTKRVKRLNISVFHSVALQLCDVLNEIHARNIMHKDINPDNIVINEETMEVKLIDFGISSVIFEEQPAENHLGNIEGTILYISPEQSGRMNRPIDYRTDLYSLGATFYFLLTGRPPFEGRLMDVIHAHLVRIPNNLNKIFEDIPENYNAIVMKLLSKDPEQRYQSVLGLKYDLIAAFERYKKLDDSLLIIGANDFSSKFSIPLKLYGREKEVEALLAIYHRVAQGGKAFLTISGYSGIGKTSLVNTLTKEITDSLGFFVSGKFDQLQRGKPYSTFMKSFRGLVKSLLAEPKEELEKWVKALKDALGCNGQVLVNVIPEIQFIIGKQPPLVELGPVENLDRFNNVMRSFLKIICKKEHPLTLFLDDLQWVDSSTLNFVEMMMADTELLHLFIVGAYRDNEVDASHIFTATLNRLKHNCTFPIHEIVLSPLEFTHVNHMVCDTLKWDNETALPVSKIIFEKTEGNPFFIRQFFSVLYEKNFIRFVTSPSPRWIWTAPSLHRLSVPDHILTLLLSQISNLPLETQTVLQLASCIGPSFTLSTLSIINNKSPALTYEDLLPAIRKGLVIPSSSLDSSSGNRKRYPSEGKIEKIPSFTVEEILMSFRWLHDRVQQAANNSIPQERSEVIHLEIARNLMSGLDSTPKQRKLNESEYREYIRKVPRLEEDNKNTKRKSNKRSSDSEELPKGEFTITDEEERDKTLFEIVDHYNVARHLIDKDSNEWVLVQELNYKAGEMAKQSIAYEAASNYLGVAMEGVSDSAWEQRYEFTLNLHKLYASVMYLLGKYNISEKIILTTVSKVKTDQEKAEILHILVVQYTFCGDYQTAIETGRKALELIEIHLPKDNFIEARDKELKQFWETLGDNKLLSLSDLPVMTNSRMIIAMRLLVTIGPPTYRSHQLLWSVVNAIAMNVLLKFGRVPSATYTYPSFGGLLGHVYNNWEGTRDCLLLTLNLCKDFQYPSDWAVAHLMIGSSLRPWSEHLRVAEVDFNTAYTIGVESGNLQYAGYAYGHNLYCTFYQGRSLAKLYDKNSFIHDSNSKTSFLCRNKWTYDLIVGFLLNFSWLRMGKTEVLTSSGTVNEALYLQTPRSGQVLTLYFIIKMQVFYICRNFEKAMEMEKEASERLVTISPQSLYPIAAYHFYRCLTLIALSRQTPDPAMKQQYLLQCKQNRRQLKIWSKSCPSNFLHQYFLVKAELISSSNDCWKALDLYDEAISLANKNEFIQDEALCNELCGRMWIARGKPRIAIGYLTDAKCLYESWGASTKVQILCEEFPILKSKNLPARSSNLDVDASNTYSTTILSDSIDLHTVLTATQTISTEILIEELLNKLMLIVMKNAGAEKGFLIMRTANEQSLSEEFLIKARGSLDQITVISAPYRFEDCPEICSTIVQYVIRTSQDIVLDDASKSSFLGKQTLPKSVLCLPILRHALVTAVLYLENNQITGAFTPNNVQVLKLLASQVAISLENAKLYTKYHNLYEDAIEGIYQITPNGNFISANPAVARMLGCSLDSLLVNSPNAVKKCYAFVEEENQFHKVLQENGVVVGFEAQLIKPDKSLIWVSDSARAVRDIQGNILYYEGSMLDLTERKEAEMAKRQSMAAEVANKAKSDFLRNMSHEFRTPMHIITGMTSLLLEREYLDSEERHYLSSIRASAECLLTLLNDVLDISQIEAGKFRLSDQPFNFHENINEIASLLKFQAERKNLQLICDIQAGMPVKVIGDPGRLRQIIINLVGNAIKFTASGKIMISFRYSDVTKNDFTLHCSVADTGRGIPADKLHSLFKVFSQVDATIHRDYGGTGLGLAISKNLVELMNGAISVESKENVGSTFSFHVKMKIDNQTNPQTFSISQLKILLVDDNKVVRLFAEKSMKKAGATVISAENGLEAVELLSKEKFDIVLMDIQMPVMDGLEATKIIRDPNSNVLDHHIPIIAMTASIEDNQFVSSGMSSYIAKPFKTETLLKSLASVFQKK